MKFLGLVGASLAVAASATHVADFQNQHDVGKVYKHEYIQTNVDETCFTIKQVPDCNGNTVATHYKLQKSGLHCLSKKQPITKEFQRKADQGERLPLENKSQDVQAFVEVPVRCVKIDSEEKRLRKETEKQSEQRIHLVQNQDGEEESFLFEQKPWTTEEQSERQHQRHLSRQNQHQRNRNQQLNSFDDEENVDEIEENLDTMQQYSDLINSNKITMHRVLKMNEDQFERLMEHLKFIAFQNRRADKWSQQIESVLPNVFAKVAKDFFENTLEKQTVSETEKEEVYQQYKDVVKRIYAYAVKQALQMKHLNQISEVNSYEREQSSHAINKLARNLWNKTKRELTNSQVEEVKNIVENAQHQKSQLDRMITEETLVVLNKNQMKQLEKDLTKTLVAGLKMVNHESKNGLESEQYRAYHSEQDEQQIKAKFHKLAQKLNTIENLQKWRGN